MDSGLRLTCRVSLRVDYCGLDTIRRLIIDWIVEMMVIGNRKPYALEHYGHSSILCSRRAPVANPSGYFGLRVIYGFGMILIGAKLATDRSKAGDGDC